MTEFFNSYRDILLILSFFLVAVVVSVRKAFSKTPASDTRSRCTIRVFGGFAIGLNDRQLISHLTGLIEINVYINYNPLLFYSSLVHSFLYM